MSSIDVYKRQVLVIYLALHVTLTLPGIAAFLLSMAIAVDANIIIFERLKEELRTGKGLRSAIDAGFKRGFTAVFDANLTTIIVAVVLLSLIRIFIPILNGRNARRPWSNMPFYKDFL